MTRKQKANSLLAFGVGMVVTGLGIIPYIQDRNPTESSFGGLVWVIGLVVAVLSFAVRGWIAAPLEWDGRSFDPD